MFRPHLLPSLIFVMILILALSLEFVGASHLKNDFGKQRRSSEKDRGCFCGLTSFKCCISKRKKSTVGKVGLHFCLLGSRYIFEASYNPIRERRVLFLFQFAILVKYSIKGLSIRSTSKNLATITVSLIGVSTYLTLH